jgi:shikimate dehydrogenase
MADLYAVVGNPVAHSLSPLIHAEFARRTAQDMRYTTILAPPDGFKTTVLEFRDAGGKGLNVTLPFKHEAWKLADVRRGGALDANAVNTIEFRGSALIGHNTDGIGLLADLEQNLDFSIRDKRVLLMGAGGATYGVMQPLLSARPQQVVVANRTPAKAIELVAHFKKFEKLVLRGISAEPYERLAGSRFDLVINATSAGLSNAMPPLPDDIFAPGALGYDMVYRKLTPFLEFAREHGAARVADGIGMLVEQAAESFFIWRGVRPETRPVIELLRRKAEG